MSNVVTRKIYYKRANWISQTTKTLYRHLLDAHKELPTTNHRTFQYHDGQIIGLDTKVSNNTIYFHVANYIPKQATSIVPEPSKSPSRNIKTNPPPNNYNYMTGDIFFAVRDNHILICASGLSEAVATSFIHECFVASDKVNLIRTYEIDYVANLSKISIINKYGVKEIELNASLYEASADYINRNSTKNNILGGAISEIASIFENDELGLDTISEKENLNVRLSIKLNTRKKGGELGKKRQLELAKSILKEEDEGFSILTANGQKITSEETKILKSVKFDRNGSSIYKSNCWDELEKYFDELSNDGFLNQ